MRKRELKRRIRELEAEVALLRGVQYPTFKLPVGSSTWSPRCTCYDGSTTGPCLVHLAVWSSVA